MIELHEIYALPSVMRWRIEALRDTTEHSPTPRLLVANRIYYRKHISDGSHKVFAITENGEEYGYGSIRLFDGLPSFDNPSGKCACLTEIYLRKPFRNHDIVEKAEQLLTEEALNCGCGKIYIGPSAGPQQPAAGPKST